MRAVAARFALGVPVRRRDSRDAASAAVPSARRRRAASSAAAPDAPESSSSLAPTSAPTLARRDLDLLLRAVELAAGSDGLTQPHPKSACVLTTPAGDVAAEAFQMGQGGTRAEILAERDAAGAARGGVAYLNLEPVHGPSAGEDAAVAALVDAGVARCVVGIEHPVAGVRGRAVAALRAAGVTVDVLREGDGDSDSATREAARRCREVNRALLYRCATGRPFSVYKYAMTLDGKIATTRGHSAWVTGPAARQVVWAERAKSDAVIVGGRTVRRDNPNLTTRREDGHRPARVVLSRTMDLPGVDDENFGLGTGDEGDDAKSVRDEHPGPPPRTNLWDTSEAATIVMTETGARPRFQARLRARGVEIIEFDELTPGVVSEYLATRGFLQVFWECGGGLAAPALRDGAIHRVMAFVAPKMIGCSGGPAPSPVGETGADEMTDATQLRGLEMSTHGRDVLIAGYVPAAGTTGRLKRAARPGSEKEETPDPWAEDPLVEVEAAAAAAARANEEARGGEEANAAVRFYKSWDANGALSNFSPHPIEAPRVWRGPNRDADASGPPETARWPTVEHFYQAQKFSGVDSPEARDALERIRLARAPEDAARIGRTLQRVSPELVRADWDDVKRDVMRTALLAKLEAHAAPRALLLASGDAEIVEDSPHDAVWGCGRDGKGGNLLGKMLMSIRDEHFANGGR